MLNVCEQFKSIQGESTFAGELCSFIRLAGCNLSCSYCDTKYALSGGTPVSMENILSTVERHGCKYVEITGGEPLLQSETAGLCGRLLDKKYTVLVETNGSIFIGSLPNGCVRIVDVKCPSSNMAGSFLNKNIRELTSVDQLKFVLSDKNDFNWALDFVKIHRMNDLCKVIFSPVSNALPASDLAQWIIDASAPVRLGLQLHTIIWGQGKKGR